MTLRFKFAMLIAAGITATAMAGKVKLYNSWGNEAGEFDLRITNNSGLENVKDSPIGLYSRTPNDPRNFSTFCLERDEYIGYSTEYTAVVSKEAKNGGKNTDANDPIHERTAYLYTKFHQGTLSNYDYGVGDGYQGGYSRPARDADANSLQKLVWWFENEYNAGKDNDNIDEQSDYAYDVTNRTLFKTFFNINDSNQMTLWFDEAAAAGWTDIGNVRVLNLSDSSGGKQDQLALIVPSPAAALLGLLGIGGVFATRRRG